MYAFDRRLRRLRRRLARSGWRRYEDVTPAELETASPGDVTASDSVVVNVHGQSHTGRMLVHLLNYADTPVLDIDLKLRGQFSSARLFSPDSDADSISVSNDGQFTHVRIYMTLWCSNRDYVATPRLQKPALVVRRTLGRPIESTAFTAKAKVGAESPGAEHRPRRAGSGRL